MLVIPRQTPPTPSTYRCKSGLVFVQREFLGRSSAPGGLWKRSPVHSLVTWLPGNVHTGCGGLCDKKGRPNVNRELPDVQAGFRKGRGTRDQLANICWIIEKAREFQKNIYFCFINYAKAFDCMDHNKLWKILREMGIPDHLTCLFRNLYAGQEATVRTGHGTTDWFQIGKGVCPGCILSPCLFNF